MIPYKRSELEVGVIHFGLGGFHRAHQAVFIDQAIRNGNLNLGIASISQRDPSLADEMAAHDSIYEVEASDGTVIERKEIGSIKESLFYPRDEARILELAKSPNLKAITLTVTEKAYKPDSEFTSRLIKVLRERYQNDGSSIALISCDNLPSNGDYTKKLLRSVISDLDFWNWIESNVRFPNCMVDRIVPAPDKDNRLLIKTEIFNQWIIENDPISEYLKDAGVKFVANVKPYELAKIRLFNGVHSFLAYYGELHEIEYVADVIRIPAVSDYVKAMQEEEIIKTLNLDTDLYSYTREIRNRMKNQSLKHRSRQIAMDGSQKLPQRIIETINDLEAKNIQAERLLNVLNTWIKYLATSDSINDPLATNLSALAKSENFAEIFAQLSTPLNQKALDRISGLSITFD